MAQTLFKGNPVNTAGELPAVGSAAPDFKVVGMRASTQGFQREDGKQRRRRSSFRIP